MKINTTCTNESDFKYKELKLEYEGNELHGYYFENEDKKEKTIAFLCHGYGSGAKVYITVEMYPCSGGTDTGNPAV